MTITVCGGTDHYTRSIAVCPVCDERHRIVSAHSSIWYDAITTCCGCGDSWSDGFVMARPFLRGWRDAARKRARLNWTRAVSASEHRAWLREQTTIYTANRVTTTESPLLNSP